MDKHLELALRIAALSNLAVTQIADLISRLRSNPEITIDDLLKQAEETAQATIEKGEDWQAEHPAG